MAVHKTEQIGVRVTADQKQDLEAAAEAAGFKVAEWVRMVALNAARSGGRRRAPGAAQ